VLAATGLIVPNHPHFGKGGKLCLARFIGAETTVIPSAGWKLDVWGRVRREVEGARARLTASAERLMAAANADVGLAHAAFYPRLMLNGLAGFSSIDANTLFNWESRVWFGGNPSASEGHH
jgi:outer membrane protein TolC